MLNPTSPDLLNLTWVQSVWPNIPLQEFVWEPVAVQGASSVVGRIHLVPELPWRPFTAVIKFGHPNMPEWAYRSAYLAETLVYQHQLVPRKTLQLPRCCFASCDAATRSFVLVLEEVAHATGGTLHTSISSPSQMHRIIQTLAHWHATWWDRPIPEGPWEETAKILLLNTTDAEEWAERVLPPLAERLGGDWLAMMATHRGQVAAAVKHWRKVLQEGPDLTLVHGDVHPGNLLFVDGQSDPVWVDWQCVTALKGVYDLALLQGPNTDIAIRRQHERAWLATYRETLAEDGIVYSEEVLRRDYSIALWFAGLRWLDLMFALGRNPTVDTRWIETVVMRVATAFTDWNILQTVNVL